MASREALGGHLADRDWMTRVLDETHARMDELADVQRYPFPVDADGRPIRDDLQGPEYMRRQRTPGAASRCAHPRPHPGAGAPGRRRRRGVRGGGAGPCLGPAPCASRPAAVVLAAGGCAFQSKTLGCDVNTGDGALMAVEAGAVLSGMEFSNAYAIAPKGTSLTKTAYYSWATFYRADRTVLEGAGSARGRSVIAKTLCDEPVFARIDRATRRRAARDAQGPAQLLPRLRPARHRPVHRLLRDHPAGRGHRPRHRRRPDRRLRLRHRRPRTVRRR